MVLICKVYCHLQCCVAKPVKPCSVHARLDCWEGALVARAQIYAGLGKTLLRPVGAHVVQAQIYKMLRKVVCCVRCCKYSILRTIQSCM